MRLLLLATLGILLAMGAVAKVAVRPAPSDRIEVLDAYLELAEAGNAKGEAAEILDEFARAALGSNASVDERRRAMRAAFERATGRPIEDVSTVIWSTGPNPARRVQMAMFRVWHLREFGTPVDVIADPSNRDLTKSIVQSVAGAGPDVIEYIGGAHLRTLVDAGIALDITEYAAEHDFGVDSVFPAAVSSIAIDRDGEPRQYGYPCNLDYKVLLYHRDLFRLAGEPEPTGGWTIDDMRAVGERVLASKALPSRPRFAFMNLLPFNAVIQGGGRLFADDRATYSAFNSPETVAALRAYQDLMYVHGTTPRPAEAASMAASTAGGFGGGATVSAPGLFAQKSVLMHIGGRWEYVVFAIANRDRVYLPAIDRRLAEIEAQSAEAGALRRARERLVRDVLLPIDDEAFAALSACLSEADRSRLLDIGVAHVPTTTGTPYYAVGARSSVVNRALLDGDAARLEHAKRFVRFLGSEAYNEQINGTFDSIAGRVSYCLDEDGVSGVPHALPGLEGFDSPVFAEAVLEYGHVRRLSPYIGRHRLTRLVMEVLEDVEANTITPELAASRAEEAVNR